MQVGIIILCVQTNGCVSMLFWDLECRMNFCVTHGCTRGSSQLVTTNCQEVGCIIEDLIHGM